MNQVISFEFDSLHGIKDRAPFKLVKALNKALACIKSNEIEKGRERGSSDATYHRIKKISNDYLTAGYLKLWNVGMDKRVSPVVLLIASISEGNRLHSKSTLLWMIHWLFF